MYLRLNSRMAQRHVSIQLGCATIRWIRKPVLPEADNA